MLPLLYGLGARDYVDHLGYVLEQCPACHTTGPFAVFQTKRKLTFYLVPTVSVRDQHVLECRTCGARFAIPPDRRDEFAARLLSHEQVADHLRTALPGSGWRSGGITTDRSQPTYYQILQVDPAADPDVIEAAFRRLAMKYHPDRATMVDAADRMRELLEAKAILTDANKRHAYDATIGVVSTHWSEPSPAPRAPGKKSPPRPEAMRADEV